MEQDNIVCEVGNCGELAICFGIKGTTKIRSCAKHSSSLLSKGMEVVSIEFYSISTLQDLVSFKERSALVEKGRGNLTALNDICDSELTAALQNIERVKNDVIKVVKSRFEEMEVVVRGVHSESKRQLSQLEKDFEQFLPPPGSQLSPTAFLLCTDMSVIPKFVRFSIADVSDNISAALSESWAVAIAGIYPTLRYFDANQKNEAIESALAEATTRAQKGILEALEYAYSIIGDDTSFEQAKNTAVSKLLAFTKMQNTKNLNLFQYLWDLRQHYALSDEATVEVGKRLARLFCHQLGRFSEAEAILQKCYNIAHRQGAISELSMLVCNEVCGVYFAREKYQSAESLGKRVLANFGAANFSSEHYWTALLYISYSMSEISKISEAKAIIESLSKRTAPKETKFGEMVRLLTCRIGASSAEAESCLLRAQRIGMSYFPTSPFTALALFHLGLSTIADARGEQYLQQAQLIYEASSPQSAQAAMNLSKLGDLNKTSKRLNEAEKYYRQAQSIYEAASSKSCSAAVNLIELGDLYSSMKRWDEVEKCCRQAQSIIQEAGPEQRPRLEDLAGKLEALRIRSSPPPVPEERKQPAAEPNQPVAVIQPAVQEERKQLPGSKQPVIQSAVQEERKQPPTGSKQPAAAIKPVVQEERRQQSTGSKQSMAVIKPALQEERKQPPAGSKRPVAVIKPAVQEERKQAPTGSKQPVAVIKSAVQEERKQPPAGSKQPVAVIKPAVQEERKQSPAGSKQPVAVIKPAAQEERKQPPSVQQPAAELPVSRQAHTQGILFRLVFDSNKKMNGRLQVLNIDSRTWALPQSPTLQMEVDFATCYTFATETTVVLCGSKMHIGHQQRECQAAGTNVYRVELAGSPPAVTSLPSFPQRRILAGLYVFEEDLLAFGG